MAGYLFFGGVSCKKLKQYPFIEEKNSISIPLTSLTKKVFELFVPKQHSLNYSALVDHVYVVCCMFEGLGYPIIL